MKKRGGKGGSGIKRYTKVIQTSTSNYANITDLIIHCGTKGYTKNLININDLIIHYGTKGYKNII